MDFFNVLFNRRSIRNYKDKEIPISKINQILKAGMMAPSAHNQQLWEFVVIDDKSKINQIADFHPYAKMLYGAPLVILICANLSKEKAKGFFAQDCSASMQNMLLAMHALGLGGVWISAYPRKKRIIKIRKMLNAPNDVIPFALIPVGYPDEKHIKIDRFDTKKIHKNEWNYKNA